MAKYRTFAYYKTAKKKARGGKRQQRSALIGLYSLAAKHQRLEEKLFGQGGEQGLELKEEVFRWSLEQKEKVLCRVQKLKLKVFHKFVRFEQKLNSRAHREAAASF